MKNLLRNTSICFLGLGLLGGCVPAQDTGELSENPSVSDLGEVQSGLMYRPTTPLKAMSRRYNKPQRTAPIRRMNPQLMAPDLIGFEDVEIFAVTDPCFDWLNASEEERENMPQALIDECEERFMEYVHAYAEHGDPTPLKGEEDPVDHGDPTPLDTDPNEDPAGHGDPTPLDGGGGTQ